MKVSTVHVQALAEAIEPLDTPERRARYLAGDFPRANLVKDLDKRYRWDLFYEAKGQSIVYESHYFSAHLDTALRHIVKGLL